MTVGMFFPLSPEIPSSPEGVSTTGPRLQTPVLSLAFSPTPRTHTHLHTHLRTHTLPFCFILGPQMAAAHTSVL